MRVIETYETCDGKTFNDIDDARRHNINAAISHLSVALIGMGLAVEDFEKGIDKAKEVLATLVCDDYSDITSTFYSIHKSLQYVKDLTIYKEEF